VGPLVVDVDVETDDDLKPSEAQLQRAKDTTIKVVSYFSGRGMQEEDRRVYFSGHKGFHVEVVFPDCLTMHASNGFKTKWDAELDKLRLALGYRTESAESEEEPPEVIIDCTYDHIRLKTSANCWGPPHAESRHRVIKVMESELAGITVDQLWALSRVN
jgi:hypothetical protein